LQQTFVFPLTALSVLTKVSPVWRPRWKKGKFWRHRIMLRIKVTKVQRCGVWTLNPCWFESFADWCWLWHCHTATYTCISPSA